jgi:TonB family protein
LDGLLDAMGRRIAQRHEGRRRRRVLWAWGAVGLFAVAGTSWLALFAWPPVGDSASGAPALQDPPTLGGVEGSSGLAACALEGLVPELPTLGRGGDSPNPLAIEGPQLLNRGDLLQVLDEEYPADLRAAEERGTTLIYFLVGESGNVDEVRMARSSGRAEFDEAAMRIAARFRFSPAMSGGGRLAAWVQVPITFAPQRQGCTFCRRIPPPELLQNSC